MALWWQNIVLNRHLFAFYLLSKLSKLKLKWATKQDSLKTLNRAMFLPRAPSFSWQLRLRGILLSLDRYSNFSEKWKSTVFSSLHFSLNLRTCELLKMKRVKNLTGWKRMAKKKGSFRANSRARETRSSKWRIRDAHSVETIWSRCLRNDAAALQVWIKSSTDIFVFQRFSKP